MYISKNKWFDRNTDFDLGISPWQKGMISFVARVEPIESRMSSS